MVLAALVLLSATLLWNSLFIIATLTVLVADLKDHCILADTTTDKGRGIVFFWETAGFCSSLDGFKIVIFRIFFVLCELVEHG